MSEKVTILSPQHRGTIQPLDSLRNRDSRPSTVRTAIDVLSGDLASHWLVESGFDNPSPVVLMPILRAGLGMLRGFQANLPDSLVWMAGLKRLEETHNAKEQTFGYDFYYLSALHADAVPPGTRVILLDPMLATAGTAIAVIEQLETRGFAPSAITMACIFTCPEGIARLHAKYPDVTILTTSIEVRLDERGYIVPGMGDAGDRLFPTHPRMLPT